MTEIVPFERVHAIQAEEQIHRAFRCIETRWTELAVMLVNFNKHEWYRQLGFPTFDGWLEARIYERRSSCRKKMRLVENLSPQIPIAILQTIPITNCERLLKAAPSQRGKLIDKAKTMSIVDFAKEVRASRGNSLASEEEVVPMTFMVELSQRDIINSALERMMTEGDDPPTKRAEALEGICQDYLNG